jgi:multicomponent Na+:H+ antiporter subunit F
VVLSLLGFVGSVSVARFSPGSDDVHTDSPADEEAERP